MKFLKGLKRRNVLAAAAVLIFLFGVPLLLGLGSVAGKTDLESGHSPDPNVLPYSRTGVIVSADKDSSALIDGNTSMCKLEMKATAYDLSMASCGKRPDEPGYGITSSGTKAKVGRTVAVDPEVIPLGSRLSITFPDEYKDLDGVYIAEDTGRLIKGNSIDIFFGEDKKDSTDIYKKAMKFGVRYVNVEILEDIGQDR